jgi:uncharacterized protein (TIGR02246 family)
MRNRAQLGLGVALVLACGSGFALGARGTNQQKEKPGPAAEERGEERRAIEQVLREQQEAWNEGNVERFLKGYWHSTELTFSGSGGVQRGWDAVLARYKRNYPDRAAMGKLDFSGLEFRFLGPEAALILGQWHLTRPPANDAGGVFSLVLQKFPEGWRIIHDHTSTAAAAH